MAQIGPTWAANPSKMTNANIAPWPQTPHKMDMRVSSCFPKFRPMLAQLGPQWPGRPRKMCVAGHFGPRRAQFGPMLGIWGQLRPTARQVWQGWPNMGATSASSGGEARAPPPPPKKPRCFFELNLDQTLIGSACGGGLADFPTSGPKSRAEGDWEAFSGRCVAASSASGPNLMWGWIRGSARIKRGWAAHSDAIFGSFSPPPGKLAS